MTLLLLTNCPALSGTGEEQPVGRLCTALAAQAPTLMAEFLPHAPRPGVGLQHPFSTHILARFGRAGVLPEALSLKKRFTAFLRARTPSVICLTDQSLLPLAIHVKAVLPKARLCLIQEGGSGDTLRFHDYADLLDQTFTYEPGHITDTAKSILAMADEQENAPVAGFVYLPGQTVFNPLSHLLVGRVLCWDENRPDTNVEAELTQASGNALENVSLDLRLRNEEWSLYEFVAVLPRGLLPEDLTLSVRLATEDRSREVLSTPIGHEFTCISAGLLSITQQTCGSFTSSWWFHETGVSLQPDNKHGRLLKIDGKQIVFGQTRHGEGDALSVNVMGHQIDFPDKHALFSGVSDAAVKDLKDIHKGETAWLIGNGPSVRHEDLNRLSGALTFGFNRLHLAYSDVAFRPSYTVCADRQMIDDFGDEIVSRAETPVFLASAERPNIPGSFTWLRQVCCFPSVFSFDPAQYVSAGGSSVFVAMQLAYYMGVRKFYLYGADFRFIFRRQNHATDRERSATGDGNHFIKNYRDGKAWSPPELRSIANAFVAADIVARLDGGFVINATRGGNLELFERADFESVVAQQGNAS